jgi:glutamate-1-semialdehyde 2,1-aminomutase
LQARNKKLSIIRQVTSNLVSAVNGSNYTRPSTIELECAEQLLDFIQGAEMVKFGKNGSDVTSAAVRLARAYTGRDIVAVSAEHPFFSFEDWFIGSTEMSSGIPEAVRGLTVKFHYNDLGSVKKLFDEYPGRIACVLLEPATAQEPKDNFLHELQDLCKEKGALFILDEIITGFRLDLGARKNSMGSFLIFVHLERGWQTDSLSPHLLGSEKS